MSNLLGNGLLALVRNSDELGRFPDNPGLAETALEALLRYDGPVDSVIRFSLSAMMQRMTEIELGAAPPAWRDLLLLRFKPA